MSNIFEIIHKYNLKVVEDMDNAIVGQINSIAIENGIYDEVTLNKKGIVNILSKAQPRKVFYDRESYACCPNCGNSYNLNLIVTRRPKYCPDCGQCLKWEV